MVSHCYYHYAEIAEQNKIQNLEKKYNLKIVYVLSHPKDSIDAWRKSANKGLQTIENWKYPKGDSIPDGTLRWAEYVKEFFPKNYMTKDGSFELPIPILMDDEKKLVKGLMLLKDEWGGTKVEQTMPTVFILDKDAKVRFKYHSQYTNDRPTGEYLEEVLEKML
ncbi:MAG: redoxin domain-containing protein [Chloroflexia bacterium]|nr:redoxin domain-containing protein [Chloroflexia bacterium]